MTTRLTFKPRLRINVLFPRLVGFAVDAIWGPGSLILLSALGSVTGVSAAGVEGTGGGVTTGEADAMVVAGREITVVDEIRASFAADGTVVALEADVPEGVSAGVAAVTVPGEDDFGIGGELRGAFSVGGAAAAVDDDVSGIADVFRNVLSAAGPVATVVGEEVAIFVDVFGDAFSVGGAEAAVFDEELTGEVVTADDGAAADVVSTVVAAVPLLAAAEFAVGAGGNMAFADGTVVPVTDDVEDSFPAGAEPVTVTGGVRDAVTAGGEDVDGAVSMTARLGVGLESIVEGTTVSTSPTISIIRRSGSRSVNAVARSMVARSKTTRTVPASN
jgi:hypothetical protein